MNSDFPMIISMLRKERRLSQKQVAADLGISQALLSHYEKGIRECGLDFLVKTAEYYDVSCDYLLGRTPNRNGAQMQPANLPDAEIPTVEQGSNMVAQVNKKVVMNTTAVIFDILDKLGNKKLTNAVSNFLMNAQYQAFRSNTSMALSPDLLSRYFEKGTASLFTLVRNAEKGVKSKFK